ncbi:MAG: aldo/keto reductase [Pseudomonadota bacterium]
MTRTKRDIGPFSVEAIGLGCMNIHWGYGPAMTPEDGSDLLLKALDLGYDFFDTATLYGMGQNENLIGDTLAGHRDAFVLASKCVLGFNEKGRFLDGRPETITQQCEDSLKRLKTETIDLYYLHRPDPNVPIEDSVGALAKLVEAGKIRCIGLSEMGADTVRRAHDEHPIAALQTEYALWTRNPEIAVLDTCRELGIAFVAFSPVGRGFFADRPINPDTLDEKDLRRVFPRFMEDNWPKNLDLLARTKTMAERAGCTVAQLALAWTIQRDDNIISIPGTTKHQHLKDNFDARNLVLADDIMTELDALYAPEAVAGPRYAPPFQATVTTEQFPFEPGA